MFEIRDFVVNELVRLRSKETKLNEVLDVNSNYSPTFKNECREIKEEVQLLKRYLHDILNNYDEITKEWRKEK